MNGLKHILVVIALLMAAMPCCHGHSHGMMAEAAGSESVITANHSCSCHSCEEAPCTDDLEMPQDLTLATALAATPASTTITLFTLYEIKPVVRQAPPSVRGVLATIQTVRLLI
ncbi:hypothetical protein PDESU_06225 [Pontiella desulfatans]|uniref:Uncharacterized protein n=1 Tax=Pontiella desulfatans TaxID=2750659 RepID=A0A6C2UE26_PONDE|nr:hypothetical protein [Pontiella desulfatans]VGO17624.1 hypothetical protein PDESU_06225 [Pontiella desulfatans]